MDLLNNFLNGFIKAAVETPAIKPASTPSPQPFKLPSTPNNNVYNLGSGTPPAPPPNQLPGLGLNSAPMPGLGGTGYTPPPPEPPPDPHHRAGFTHFMGGLVSGNTGVNNWKNDSTGEYWADVGGSENGWKPDEQLNMDPRDWNKGIKPPASNSNTPAPQISNATWDSLTHIQEPSYQKSTPQNNIPQQPKNITNPDAINLAGQMQQDPFVQSGMPKLDPAITNNDTRQPQQLTQDFFKNLQHNPQMMAYAKKILASLGESDYLNASDPSLRERGEADIMSAIGRLRDPEQARLVYQQLMGGNQNLQ